MHLSYVLIHTIYDVYCLNVSCFTGHKQHPYAVDRHTKSPVDFNRDWLLPIESPECTSQRSPHSVDSGTGGLRDHVYRQHSSVNYS